MDCLFCKIIAGEIPSKTVYEDAEILASVSYTHLASSGFFMIGFVRTER